MPEGLQRREFVRRAARGVGAALCAPKMGTAWTRASLRAGAEAMSLDDKIGQLMCQVLSAPNVEELVVKGRVGSLYIQWEDVAGITARQQGSTRVPRASNPVPGRGSARATAEHVNYLQSIARHPILFVGEQEQGIGVNFAAGTEFPAYMALGAARSKELAYLFGEINALEGRAVGYGWISSPTLDVNIEPVNPIINTRSLGDRPGLVTELGLETCRAIVEHRGLTCICHFPGHGASAEDSHVGLPVIGRSRDALMAVELAPYRAGIPAGFMNCIMTAHNSYPALEPQPGIPATLSHDIMTRLLRRQLKYDGLVATDGLDMKAIADNFSSGDAAVKAVLAGCDILLGGDQEAGRAAIRQAVESGVLPMSRLEESVTRVLAAKRWLGLLDEPAVDVGRVDAIVGCARHRAVAKRVATEAITVLRREGDPPPNSRKLLVLSSAGWCDLCWGLGDADAHVFSETRKRAPEAATIALGQKGERWADARAAARQADAIVLAFGSKVRHRGEESRRANRELFALVNEIAALGKPTSTLVFGNPYAVAELPHSQLCLCAYSACADSVAAAFEVAFGERKSKGRLPVTISREYPYGFGL